jgi:tetratricopeptide (TPR) repeat protein
MWEVREPQAIIQAAEKAAAAGSFSSAEKLLREAARLQEASLGPRHPDLANTLNNLGIVCEMTRKFDDAEQYFRRAVSIARTSLPPDHPFVTTSHNNLRDFCEARGKTAEAESLAPEALETAPAATSEATSTAPEAKPAAPEKATDQALEDPVLTSKKFFYRMALGALGPIAMLMVVLAIGLPRLGAPELASPSRDVAEAAPATAAPMQPDAVAQPVEPAKPVTAPPTATAPERPIVIRAGLCGEIDAWSCDPADRPVPPGPLFFYTQIKATSATMIQHRWYQGNRLRQSVDLRIEANQSAGYRTYSRYVMQLDSAGNWRVEVRSQDGVLLDEERFEVR